MHSQILYYKTKTFRNTVRDELQYNNHFPIYIKTYFIFEALFASLSVFIILRSIRCVFSNSIL